MKVTMILPARLRHLAYTGAWKKLEPAWDLVIRCRQVFRMLPVLESVLAGFGRGSRPVTQTASRPYHLAPSCEKPIM